MDKNSTIIATGVVAVLLVVVGVVVAGTSESFSSGGVHGIITGILGLGLIGYAAYHLSKSTWEG